MSTTDPFDEALAVLRSGDMYTGIYMLRKMTLEGCDRPEVHFNLGLALNETRQYQEAVIALKKCIELDMLHQPSRVALGVAYTHLGQPEMAKLSLLQAVSLNPSDGLALMNLAAVLPTSVSARAPRTPLVEPGRRCLATSGLSGTWPLRFATGVWIQPAASTRLPFFPTPPRLFSTSWKGTRTLILPRGQKSLSPRSPNSRFVLGASARMGSGPTCSGTSLMRSRCSAP